MKRFVAVLVFLLHAAALSTADAARKMNVVFLLADDMRPDALGCTGTTAVKTPNLDRLATRGTLLTRATCGYPSAT